MVLTFAEKLGEPNLTACLYVLKIDVAFGRISSPCPSLYDETTYQSEVLSVSRKLMRLFVANVEICAAFQRSIG